MKSNILNTFWEQSYVQIPVVSVTGHNFDGRMKH